LFLWFSFGFWNCNDSVVSILCFSFFFSFITALYILDRICINCIFLWVPNSSISWINIHWIEKYVNIFKLILYNFSLFFVLYIFVIWIYRWENINASDKKKSNLLIKINLQIILVIISYKCCYLFTQLIE
jgi:hypothetical protein